MSIFLNYLIYKIFLIALLSVSDIDTNFKCARVDSIAVARVLSNLVTLFEKSSRCLGNLEKENCVNFLNEFYDVFFHDVIAGNYKFGEHVINVKNSSLMKQILCK